MVATIIVFLLVLSILVLVHELGHFLVGRFFGVGVLEFALGLPFTRPIFSRKLSSGMKISLYPLLFGGFVRLLGEEGEESKQSLRSSPEAAGLKSVTQSPSNPIKGKYFYNASVWQRIGVVVAGVVMNFLLAVTLFYGFLALSGFKVLIPRLADYRFLSPSVDRVVVTLVQEGSPAESAGLVEGDVILTANGKQFSTLSEFQTYTKSRSGQLMKLELVDVSLSIAKHAEVTPRKDPPAGQGPLGIGIGEGVVVRYQTWPEKVLSGGVYAVDMLAYNLKVLARLGVQTFQTKSFAPLSENVSGPVGIAGAVGSILGLGGNRALVAMFNFVGLLSLSLAFMNILPIPALDGGRLMFLLVEAIFGKKLAAQKENLINQIGMAVLLGLIVLISFSDLAKLLTK